MVYFESNVSCAKMGLIEENPIGSVSQMICNVLAFPLRNPTVAVFLKNNQASFGGKQDNPSRSTFAAGAVTALDEISDRQCLLCSIGLHDRRIGRVIASPLSGIPLMQNFMNLA